MAKIANDSQIGGLKNGRLGVVIDGDDHFGILDSHYVLHHPGNAYADVKFGTDGLAALADHLAFGNPAFIEWWARAAHSSLQDSS